MKIVYIIKSFANKAGTERIICDKINYLAEKGHAITRVTYEQGNHSFAFSLHPSVCYVDLNTRFFIANQLPIYKRAFCLLKLRKQFKSRLQKRIDEINPDIIISTTYSIDLINIILSVKSRARMIVESHVACFSIKKSYEKRRYPVIRILAFLYDSFMFRTLGRCDAFVSLTKGDASDWEKYIPNVTVIPNFATMFPECLPSYEGVHHRIIAVGRLHVQKGFDMLIDAFSMVAERIPAWQLCIFGSGGEEQFLNQKIREYKLARRIQIVAPTDDIYEEYKRSDFLVFSSRFEGFGLVLLESMSCGIPCVAFRCKYGPEDIITHQKDGLLVSDGDVKELADQILWMATHTDERLLMGLEARKTASHFKKEAIMQLWIELFESLL